MNITDPVTVSEAAKIIGVVVQRVRVLCREGKELVAEKFGRDWVVSRAAAEAYRDREPPASGAGRPRSKAKKRGKKP